MDNMQKVIFHKTHPVRCHICQRPCADEPVMIGHTPIGRDHRKFRHPTFDPETDMVSVQCMDCTGQLQELWDDYMEEER